MSSRKRADRGRSGGNGDSAGEQTIWDGCQDSIKKIMELVQTSEACKKKIFAMEADFAEMENNDKKPSVKQIDALSALQREQVKLTDQIAAILKGGNGDNTPLLESLTLLRALISHNEKDAMEPYQSQSSRRGASSREAHLNRSSMDVDGANDSPMPSPAVANPPRAKDRAGGPSRASQPPKEPLVKREVDTGGMSADALASSGVEVNAKGKITFAVGAEVAFKPKPSSPNTESEWIQGVVVKVIGEGKSRRYDVQDPEPDEVTSKPGAVYRTSASSMVPIPRLGVKLGAYEPGRAVLARYPDTTTFYRAEVVGSVDEGRRVVLRFEGEEDEKSTKEVDRRFVLDHKG